MATYARAHTRTHARTRARTHLLLAAPGVDLVGDLLELAHLAAELGLVLLC
jgi:hypothetical protein